MRINSELWVKAYLRQAAAHGAPGYVLRKGDERSGAIFIKIARRDRLVGLFGPAPAGFDDNDQERRWVPLLKGEWQTDFEVQQVLEREQRFDSDLWVVEVESADGSHFLDGWLLATLE